MLKDRFNLDDASLTTGVFLAFVILVFHVVMLFVMALLVIFFGFIIKHFAWILLAMGLVTAGTIFYVLYSLRKQSSSIAEVLATPEFRGKTIELRLFGGLASMKVADSRESAPLLEHDGRPELRYLESPDSLRVRELLELARLLENDLITPEEYRRAKSEVFSRQSNDLGRNQFKKPTAN